MCGSTHPNNGFSRGVHPAQKIIYGYIQCLCDVAESLQTGITGTIFDMPERFHGDTDFLCQNFARNFLFLSGRADPLTHENDVDFHIVHLYALSTVR
jgi:hypothetical protein